MDQSPTPSETPYPPYQPFPIVGIGASAGGLAAFQAFFSGMPEDRDPGMAFVLVQHLSPDFESDLPEIIRRATRLPVFEIEDNSPVRPNCVYVLPPNRELALAHGILHLLDPSLPRGQRLPIDNFFRSLADDQGGMAIGIVLSGTGSDGSLGLQAIKRHGGLAVAQKPESAQFDFMPLSAIATGMVDYVLEPAEMPGKLVSYHAFGMAHTLRPDPIPSPKAESAWKKIILALRNQMGQDFSEYKPSTLDRRIERRMAVNLIPDLEGYAQFISHTPGEAEALFRDILIGVTQFFRDKEAFAALEEQVLPKLMEGRDHGTPIRIWIAGCSTGEEAYSISILLQERMERMKQGLTVQIFASDIDDRAIQFARQGRYPASIAGDMSPERLSRFFVPEPGGGEYRVQKNIRDMIVFSTQNLIKDPPFSKIDLISCRNLLIYLTAGLQKKIIPVFHYALNPGGFLILGNSEGVGEFDDLFAAVDRKAKIYRRKEGYHGVPSIAIHRFSHVPRPPLSIARTPPGSPATLREVTERALIQVAPAAALVNAGGDILYLHGRTGMFLEPAPGAAGMNNILKMAREGLEPGLAAALRKAVASKETVKSPVLTVRTNGHFSRVVSTVYPLSESPASSATKELYLILLQEAAFPGETPEAASAETPTVDAAADRRVEALQLQLRFKDELLQSAKEELEGSNEELHSSNEEMQSINEELQSANEELETSKEELQSVNEELATVNAELQNKVLDLSRINNDMNNLLEGSGIATVFINHQMRILRFTPAATEIINLIPGDVGRPVGHIVSNLSGYSNLIPDVQSVLKTLTPVTHDVQLHDGRWFNMRILPYRTQDNVIEGAVISFMDVSERKRALEELRQANEVIRKTLMSNQTVDCVIVADSQGRILWWNQGAERMYGWTEAEALLLSESDRIPEEERQETKRRQAEMFAGKVIERYKTIRLAKSGARLEVLVSTSPLKDEGGRVYAIAATERPSRPGESG